MAAGLFRANCGRKQVQQILAAASSNVMQNNRPTWLARLPFACNGNCCISV